MLKRARVASQVVDPVNQYREIDEDVRIGLAQRNRESWQRITDGPAIDLGDRQLCPPRDNYVIGTGRDPLLHRQRRTAQKEVDFHEVHARRVELVAFQGRDPFLETDPP